jgi:hypothetical protein
MKKKFENKAPRYQFFEIINRRLWEYLKTQEFKSKKGGAFSKNINDVIWYVGITDITGFIYDYLHITIEICVYSPYLDKKVDPTDWERDWRCSQVRFGLDKLAPLPCVDKEFGGSFFIHTLNQAYDFAEKVVDTLDKKAMPILQNIDSTEKIIELYKKKPMWMFSLYKNELHIEWELLIWTGEIDPKNISFREWLEITHPEFIEEQKKMYDQIKDALRSHHE